MTTFKIMSDLHLEFQDGREHEFTVPYDGEDALILAGDVQCGMVLEDWFCDLLEHRPVFYIMGNHEYYLNVALTKPKSPCEAHKIRLTRHQAAARACRSSSL